MNAPETSSQGVALSSWRLPVPAVLSRTDPRKFTRLSTLTGTLLLTIAVLTRFLTSYNDMDFGQFYMAGVIARTGHWEALYPVPIPNSRYNVGENEASAMRPAYAALSEEYKVGDTKRFMQPPPNALAYLPFAFLSYRAAHFAWTILSIVCASAIAFQAARIFDTLSGRPTHAAGLLAFLVATSPTMYQSVRIGQVSTLMGCLIGLSLLGLVKPQRSGEAIAIVLASLTKYAAAVLLPVFFAMRRWRTLLLMCLFTAAIIAGSILIMGLDPWRTWITQVAPTLGRTHDWSANQSIDGLLIHLTGQFPMPHNWEVAVRILSFLTLAPLLLVIFTRTREYWRNPANIFAACAALLCWLQFFSPIFWTNYYPYLFPLWGWLAWEGMTVRRSLAAAAAATVAMLLAWFPFSVIAPHLPLPLAFHILFSSLIMLLFALTRMLKPMQSAACPAAESPT